MLSPRPLLLVSLLLLAGCGGDQATNVDRALLFDFPTEPEEVKGAAARILAQAEKDGGECLAAARELHEAAGDFEISDRLADEAAVDSVDLDSDVTIADSDEATKRRSETYDVLLDAKTKTTDACAAEN